MPENGQKNTSFGVYSSVCCGFEIVITEGTYFPDCPNHPKLTTEWKPLRDLKEPIPHASQLDHRKNDNSAA